MKIKKVLSAVLCLSILLGVAVPILMGIAPAAHADEIYTVRIEAENAYWNGYQAVKTSTTGPNPTVIANAANTHTYATWGELSAMKLNKNIHIYVAFCVEVPKAGTYQISTGNVIRMSKDSTPFAAILVNPQHNGKAYQLPYSAVDTNAAYCVSDQVNVQLQKGRNMIYMVPFTGDQSINWADADYIEITGDYAVSHVAPTVPVTVAADAGGSHKFSTVSAGALAGADVTAAQGLTVAAITRGDLALVPHVSYTVDAPADGYYDISLKFSCSGSNTVADYAVALLVDDRPAETKGIYTTGSNIADISTYLTKGTHVLSIPVILPRTDETKAVYWSDLQGLILNDGLTLSNQFYSLSTGSVLEAETYAFAWRYPTIAENNGRKLVGGSQPGMVKQTYDQLVGGAKLDKNQPMLTYQVEVLTEGEYTLNVSYRDYAGDDYYMIVSVDDAVFAKAPYVGADPNYTDRRLAQATLNLTEGRHIIRLITLPGDSQAPWIDVDYAAIKGADPVLGVKDWVHLQSANTSNYQGFTGTTASHSAYGPWWSNALSGYQGNSMADNAGVTVENFTPGDLSKLGFFSYSLHVPRDGFYDMQTYLQPDPESSGTGKVLLGIEKIDANMINQAYGVIGLSYTGNSSGWLDLDGEYSSFGAIVKNNAELEKNALANAQAGFSMALRVTMDNGKSYAFQIAHDGGYTYSRPGNGSETPVDANTAELIDGAGALFQVERTADNVLTVTLKGKVIDICTMEGVTAENKVVSVGFRQYGNPTDGTNQAEVRFEAVPVEENVQIDLPGIENGTVTTEQEGYKVGQTVVLNVTPEKGYSQKLTVNGEPILLDWQTGKYSFVAQKGSYDIDGSFEKIRWNTASYQWVDVRLDVDAQRWWIADLSSYLTEGDYLVTVSGLMDYSGKSYDWCDMGALTVSGGITVAKGPGDPVVSDWGLLDDQLGVQFAFENLAATDTVEFYVGNQLLRSKQVAGDRYAVSLDSGHLAQAITIKVNGSALQETYVPQTVNTGLVREEALTGAVTKLDAPGELFYRNDNLTGLADPFILDNTARDGYYYLYGTWGAFRCFRSKNLMDWQDCGEVLQQYRENNKIWDSTQGKYSYQALGSDLWAPEVVYDAETKLYYMFFSATPDLKGQATVGSARELLMVATATSPAGPFNLVNFKSAGSCGAGNVHNYSMSTYPDYFAPYLFLDPAQNRAFSERINNEWRGGDNGGYIGNIDAHPYVAADGTKYLFWVDSRGADRICGVEMENWLKPKWETAVALTYNGYYTVNDWKAGSTNRVSYESNTTNEGPFITEHNGKFYMTFSCNNWKNNTYLVAQAVSDNILGPYTKLKESEGGVVLSGMRQGSQTSSGTGHHSIVSVGDQLLMVYHRHNDPAVGGGARNHAVDEIKWITVNGRELMYVNGPNVTVQPKVEKHSDYRNIAGEATVSASNSSVNTKYLNDGLLSHLKNGHANVIAAVGETAISGETTFAFRFDEARTVRSVMVYNSRKEGQIFRQIKQIKLVCLENGKIVIKYLNNVPFNAEYIKTNTSGKVTYAEPCAAAYAVFGTQKVLSVEITVEIPAGQTAVGISEVRILGK